MTKTTTDTAAVPRLLTLEEAAETLNISLKTLRRRIAAGDLPAIQDGRILRVHPRDLEHYIASRRKI